MLCIGIQRRCQRLSPLSIIARITVGVAPSSFSLDCFTVSKIEIQPTLVTFNKSLEHLQREGHLVGGFRYGSLDSPVMLWRVSSLQPKTAERCFRQGSILLYLVGKMASSKHLKAVTHRIGGVRQPCFHPSHGMVGFVIKAGKCLHDE